LRQELTVRREFFVRCLELPGAIAGLAPALIAVLVALPGPATAASPSFDCSRASAPIEKLICSSDPLAELDGKAGALFRALREAQDEATRATSLQEQRRWLQSRLSQCHVPATGEVPPDAAEAARRCLTDLYQARVAALQARIALATPTIAAPGNAAQASAPQASAAQANAAQASAPQANAAPAVNGASGSSAPASGTAAKSAATTPGASPPPRAAAANPPPAAPVAPALAKLSRSLFPAKGNNEALATIADFGRYAIVVKSDQGTAVQLVDRMAGPGSADGAAGHIDGRLDTFLDRGQYKVRLFSDPRGSGDADLAIVPSVETNPQPQQLLELKPIAAELGDHEQRSYWLEIKERRFVALEAAGRYLADLRLSKDGNWLVDAQPAASVSDPTGGEPLAVRQLALWLEPGLYRLTAYGGIGEKWSSGSQAKSFYLRYGIPTLPDSGRASHIASPFGIDRWLVPVAATYFRLDIDTAEHAVLSAGSYAAERPFAGGGARVTIEKDSRDPKAELHVGGGGSASYRLVTVERKPGARYRLQYFDDRRERVIDNGGGGRFWLATLQAGNPEDGLDPTAILTRDNTDVVEASTVEVEPGKAWRRRYNLLGPLTLFLHAAQPTELATEDEGGEAWFTVMPFLTTRPLNFRPPVARQSGASWTLDRGYYVLSVRPGPESKGIHTMTLRPAGAPDPEADAPRLVAPLFADLSLPPRHSYGLYLNITGEAFGGAVLRPLPLDLDDGVSFEIAGGARTELPVVFPREGELHAEREDGTSVALSLDGQAPTAAPIRASGAHRVGLSAGDQAAFVSLIFTPAERLDTTPLPEIPASLVNARPNFPVLTASQPAFLDLAPKSHPSFTVTVDQPALYRLETSGIIETAGVVRTRTVLALDRQQANGVGRNFLIQRYLREGDYQLTVSPAGRSAGDIGVHLNATPVADLGALEPGLWARATLAPGEAGRYRIHIAEAGTYDLKTLGLHHDFAMRFEDADGWPLLPPGGTASATLALDAGDYQMVLLPRPVDSRAVTLLQRVVPPEVHEGHGPFALALEHDGQNRWMEPEDGQPRVPDRWRFTLPAASEVTVTVDSGMRATLVGADGGTDRIAFDERPWTGTVPAGGYTVEVVSAASNSRVDYTLRVSTAELLVGERRTVTAPARLPIAIGGDRQVDLASFGGEDVRARLYDGDGNFVAGNDDRENDWNFLISRRLPAGRYALQVDPVGAKTAATEVGLDEPEEVADAAIAFDRPAVLADGRVHVVPLSDAPTDSLVVIAANAAAPSGLAIEAADPQGSWRTLGTATGLKPYLAVPRGGDATRAMRARVWAIDHGHAAIDFIASTVSPSRAAENVLTGKGVALAAFSGGLPDLGAAHVRLDKPGLLSLVGDGAAVAWSSDPAAVASVDRNGMIVASSADLWLVDRIGAGRPSTIAARRIDPQQGGALHLAVKAGRTIELPLAPATPKEALVLWQVDGQGGQPGIAVVDRQGSGKDWRSPMAVGANLATLGSALTVAPVGATKPALMIWDAGGSTEEMPVIVTRHALSVPEAQPLDAGVTDGKFVGRETKLYGLPPGAKRLGLVLPVGTAAVLYAGGAVERLIWASAPDVEVLDTSADRLLLVPLDDHGAPFSLTLETTAVPDTSLRSGTVLTRFSPTPGVIHLSIAATDERSSTLRLAGGAREATIIRPDGTVARGNDLAAPAGSLVSVAYQPGLFGIALDPAKGAPVAVGAPTAVTLPATLALSGAGMAFRVAAGPARLIRITTDTPILLRARTGTAGAVPLLFSAGANLNLTLAADMAGDVEILPAGTAVLSGSAHVDAIPLQPITEGLGPKLRLAPGQSRAFSFTLPKERTVGVGVRASVDIATCRLLTGAGEEIGRGLVHMHTLRAGTYVLAVDAPSDGPAIDIEPALVGAVLPDNGPPDDVKAGYLALVGKRAQ
jgi:uncharacterized protein